jgi:hypothetical protein
MKRFVYATDFSENSRYVAGFINAVSKKEEVEVLLLHAFPDITDRYGPIISQFSGLIEAWEKAKKSAEENLIEWENRLWSWGIKVSSKLVIRDPVQETIKEAGISHRLLCKVPLTFKSNPRNNPRFSPDKG